MDVDTIIIRDGSNHVEWYGILTGETTLVSLNEVEGIVIVHIKGRSVYRGQICRPGYAPAEYQVLKIIAKSTEPGVTEFDVQKVAEFPARLPKAKE